MDKFNGVIALIKPRGLTSTDLLNLLKYHLTIARIRGMSEGEQARILKRFPEYRFCIEKNTSSEDEMSPKKKTLLERTGIVGVDVSDRVERTLLNESPAEASSNEEPDHDSVNNNNTKKSRYPRWPFMKELKIGHGGTLDPLASGTLVVGLNSGTKSLNAFMNAGFGCRKGYLATVRLGCATDSYDSTGKVVSLKDVDLNRAREVSESDVKTALVDLFGDFDNEEVQKQGRIVMQKPPVFSALRVNGKRMHELARQNQVADMPEIQARPVTLFNVRMGNFGVCDRLNVPVFEVSVECGGGTYIRSIVHDLGEKLGCGAHMTGLVRTHQGPFELHPDEGLEVFDGDVLMQDGGAAPLQAYVKRMQGHQTTVQDYVKDLIKNEIMAPVVGVKRKMDDSSDTTNLVDNAAPGQ